MHIFNHQEFDRWVGHLNQEKHCKFSIIRGLTDVGNFLQAKLTWQLFSQGGELILAQGKRAHLFWEKMNERGGGVHVGTIYHRGD